MCQSPMAMAIRVDPGGVSKSWSPAQAQEGGFSWIHDLQHKATDPGPKLSIEFSEAHIILWHIALPRSALAVV